MFRDVNVGEFGSEYDLFLLRRDFHRNETRVDNEMILEIIGSTLVCRVEPKDDG